MAKDDAGSTSSAPRVEIVRPQQGGIERTTTQIGTVIAFESAKLFSKISGYLKSQAVDIGDHVARGDLLAEIDAPERVKEVDQAKAELDQATAQVAQADARILTATADRAAALAAVKTTEAQTGLATATLKFREKQYRRIKSLFDLKSVDERLVDEQLSEVEAARSAEEAAFAAVSNAKALVDSAAARIEQTKADAAEARAKVEVATATLAKSEVFVRYLKIVSPYDGVVTNRSFFRGDFIRSADQESHMPVLAIDRTDQMRVVVRIPDRDVPFTNRGQEATVKIDALPGVRFSGKVSRVAEAEETETRTMRAEIDLANPDKLLRQGMYGQVTIHLGALPGALRVPSLSLVGSVTDGDGTLYVCRGGVAHLVSVRLGIDNGVEVEILAGLSPSDDVVRRPGKGLSDGAQVIAVKQAADSHAAPPTPAAHAK